MDIKCKFITELKDGSAIVEVSLDAEAKDYLLAEGFIAVIQEALRLSKSYIPKVELKRIKKEIKLNPKVKPSLKK